MSRNSWSTVGVEVDQVTVFRWVQRFTPLLSDAARFCRHAPGTGGMSMRPMSRSTEWRYVYRAIDQYGQVIDALVSVRRDATAARRFFQRSLEMLKVTPTEVGREAGSHSGGGAHTRETSRTAIPS